MKHIRTYENFWKKLKNRTKKTLTYTVDFFKNEQSVLENLLFKFKPGEKYYQDNRYVFESNVRDLEIIIKKKSEEPSNTKNISFSIVSPSKSNIVFTVNIKEGQDSKNFRFIDDFNGMVEFIKKYIPDEELQAKKYNL